MSLQYSQFITFIVYFYVDKSHTIKKRSLSSTNNKDSKTIEEDILLVV